MPYETANISTFCNKFINTPETIGTGDAVDTTFSYTVSKTPIFKNGVEIEYTIATTTYQITSDADGVFTGTGISSGTVTEAGLIDLVFSTAPDDTTLIRVLEYTTKGMLQKFIDFICSTSYEESIGVGDGIETAFGVTLANTDVAKGQARLRFKIAGVVYWVWDNGNGEFIHDLIASSSLAYDTGITTVTFAEPIDDTFDVEILYTDGVEGQDWIILNEDLSQDSGLADAFPGLLLKQYVITNSGSNYAERIVLGFRENQYITENRYAINLNFYKQWEETEHNAQNWNINAFATSYDATRESFSGHPSTALNDTVQTYYFKATKDYVFSCIKVSGTVYTNFYGGCGIRFASIQTYKNPHIIIGNLSGTFSFSNVGSTHSMIANPNAANNAWIINKDNNYKSGSSFTVIPTKQYTLTGEVELSSNSKIMLNEIFIVDIDASPELLLFQVRDIYHTPYINFITESTIDDGVDTYIGFQNIFRNSSYDYFAIKNNN